jgi:hypothetical protein
VRCPRRSPGGVIGRSYRVGRVLLLDFLTVLVRVVVRPPPRAFSASRMVFRALLSHEALPLRSLGGSDLIWISISSSATSHTGSTGGRAAVERRAVDLRAAGMRRILLLPFLVGVPLAWAVLLLDPV